MQDCSDLQSNLRELRKGICYQKRYQGSSRQIGFIRRSSLLRQIHLTETTGHGFTGESESRVVSAVNVSDQFVHLLVVAFGREIEGLFKGVAAGEEAAESEKRSTSERSSVDAFVILRTPDAQDGDAGPDVDKEEWVERVSGVVVLWNKY